jgi:two-component system, cell cycle sensor histidine kinase and response regulator CckA
MQPDRALDHESRRMEALRRYEILDTPAEVEFDDFTRLAAYICGTPTALISFVDADRQWFKSKVGLEVSETPRSVAFCSKAIEMNGLMEVPNALDDERFRTNPLVTGAPNIRFYAGSPLVSPDGMAVGTLCVIDYTPRSLTPQQRDAIEALGRQVVRQLELRMAARKEAHLNRDLSRKTSFQQALLDSADFAIISTTPDGVITSFSRGAEALLGYTAAEVVGKTTPGLFHDGGEVAARAQELTRELGRKIEPGFEVFVANEQKGKSENREWNYVRKDGSRVPVLLSVAAIHDEKGGLAGYLGIARDVSTINEATAALAESESKLREMNARLDQIVAERTEKLLETEERFRLMVEGVKDYAIIMLDAQGRVISWNAGAQRFKGYSDDEIIGKHFSTFYVPEDVDQGKPQKALDTARTEGRFEDEGWRIRKDGSRFWESVIITALRDKAGRLRGFAKVARDITEHREAQLLTLRTQRLESIGTLAGGIAHDLNNALAPILMGVELIRLSYPDASGTVDLMEASARHGAGMVRQLLTFAKGVEGEQILINPRHLFDQIGAIVESTFPKSISLRKRCPSDLHAILGDATQLYQVLLNLCVNARDAMPDGGTLTLDAENCEIDETFASSFPDAKVGTYVVWRVRDTGSGIQPEVLERIFEPFFSTKGPEKGTGLGLSTVLGIVKSHGGFIRVYSVIGQGSTFAIYLPADPSAAASGGVSSTTSSPFLAHGEMVLIVDDDSTVRKISRSVLTAMKFQVVTASDGTEALMQVAEKRADLRVVITDLHMPNMDGLTFVRVLRHMMPKVGIIVSSGHVDERDRLAFKELGVTTLLEKPFSREMLIAALQSVLQNDVTFSI